MSKIFLTSPKVVKDTISLPMIEFSQTASSIDFTDIDTLMFTSKQAVFTADSITSSWREFDSIAIGPATKRAILESGGKVLFQPKEFYGKELAKDILEHFKDRKILYLRPKKIIFNAKEFLAKYNINLKEQIIYQTSCKKYSPSKAPPDGSIIVFTSPSTISCFLESFGWRREYKAVVIGTSTKIHLPKDAEYKVAKEPSIRACVELAFEWAKS